jgi:threonine/homoserine/homoserine lactone efflux protein
MHPSFFAKGFIIGILINAPLGPIGLLCVQRTLSKGKLYGLMSGLGAATADAVYSFIPAFGLTLVSNFLVEHLAWFRPIGGVFLCCLGVKAFLSKSEPSTAPENRVSHFGAYLSTLFLTLMNPLLLLVFIAVFTGFELVSPNSSYGSSALLVMGIFLGSGVWWLLLSSVAGIFRERLTSAYVQWIKKISGIIMTAFGLIILLSLN